ncbi:sulfonate ABC transporter ATP-binding protein [Serinibacter arcticus]|uniref:Sulfonate ABC transporter ATP-binding protein n=1 Tax=Serinibacter arcticus TaxID=1655435 RepID=A0A2U1ZVZ6_9MICO|nr:ABC transporter ATP-binding protein [Serinibacter arcticus]PWD51165.1 sulfonate ABC transporter ATP-binding protein [Serinibacter arcticus]
MSKDVTLSGVGRTFSTRQGDVVAIDGVDLHVDAGEFVALIGPSGCGKSTVLRCVAGLDTHHTGSVRVGEREVVRPSTETGMVFQEHRLLPWLTVEQNILFGFEGSAAERAGRAEELLALMHLEAFAKAYPPALSGGMAQRASIARALAPRPDVLLLDEPFGALDAFTRIEMQDALREVWRAHGTTAILVTHDIDEAVVLANRVVVMAPRPGRIKHVQDVPLDFPRNRGSDEFAHYRTELLAQFDLVH